MRLIFFTPTYTVGYAVAFSSFVDILIFVISCSTIGIIWNSAFIWLKLLII